MDMDRWVDRTDVYIPQYKQQSSMPIEVLNRPHICFAMKDADSEMKNDDEIKNAEDAMDDSEMMVSIEETVFLDTAELQNGIREHIFITRMSTSEKIEITTLPFILGKQGTADFVIDNNEFISRQHAKIVKQEDDYYLEDLGSKNHTYVDNVLVSEIVKLSDGEIFRLANEDFMFNCEDN